MSPKHDAQRIWHRRCTATCTKAKSKKYFHYEPIVKIYDFWRYVRKYNVMRSNRFATTSFYSKK